MKLTYAIYKEFVTSINVKMAAGEDMIEATTNSIDYIPEDMREDSIALGSATGLVKFLKDNMECTVADASLWDDTARLIHKSAMDMGIPIDSNGPDTAVFADILANGIVKVMSK